MSTGPDPTLQLARLQLAREMRLVESAVAMVASGGAPRVHLGGLAFGDAVVEHARSVAAGSGIRVVPVWRTDELGLDLEFERGVDATPAGEVDGRG